MKAIFIGLVSICMVAAGPLKVADLDEALRNDNPGLIGGIILGLLDDLRETIYNGSDDLPVLDPLYIEELTLNDETIPLPGAHIHIADTTVKNIGSFDVDELRVTTLVIVNYVHLSGYIPVVEIESGQYDLSVSAAGINVFGAGRASIKVINPRITADLQIRVGLSGLTLAQCDVKFTLGAFEPQITGLFGHEGASDFANLFLRDFVPQLVKLYETEINDFLSDIVREIVADALP